MESLIKFLPTEMLLTLGQLLLIKVGNSLKNKDDNDTGNDDAAGNVCIAIAPVLPAFASSTSESLRKKVMKSAYIAFGNYLGYPPPAE